MRIADPRPWICTCCGNSQPPEIRYVDTGAVREGPVVYDKDTGGILIDPAGALVELDDVFICEPCVRAAGDVIGYIPRFHEVQLTEIRRLRAENEALETENDKLRAIVGRVEVAA